MNKLEATKILGDSIEEDGSLSCGHHNYIDWPVGDKEACLDGEFESEEIEAILWWINNIKKESK